MKELSIILFLIGFVSCQEAAPPRPVSVEFRIVEKTPVAGLDTVVFTGWGVTDTFFAQKEVLLSGAVISSAEFTIQNGHPAIAVSFNEEGADGFARITGENIGKHLGMFVDGEFVSAPLIRDEILGGRAIIDGDFTEEQARDIADRLDRQERQ